jgi:hypothetical protein
MRYIGDAACLVVLIVLIVLIILSTNHCQAWISSRDLVEVVTEC